MVNVPSMMMAAAAAVRYSRPKMRVFYVLVSRARALVPITHLTGYFSRRVRVR